MNLPFLFVDDVAAKAGEIVARVPAKLADKAALFDVLVGALELPGYFGHDWDALDECLRDLGWLDGARAVLVHADVPLVGDERRTYLQILRDVMSEPGPRELVAVFPRGARGDVEKALAR